MSKLPDISGSATLGDIDDILHDESVSDLSWLDVDIDDYKSYETLPKQNLDWIPEVARALRNDDSDSRVPVRIPLRRNTIVNTNPLEHTHISVRSSNASINTRVAVYMMAGLKHDKIKEKLSLEFGKEDLDYYSDNIELILSESGVLGNIYINSSHFPKCSQNGPHRSFVKKYAKNSLFVLSNQKCYDCIHNKGGRCASFNKKIVDSVPYNEATYAHYLPKLISEHRIVSNIVNLSDKDRKKNLRIAFSRIPIISGQDSVKKIQHRSKPSKINITEKDIRDFWDRRASVHNIEQMPGPIYMMAAKRVMLGTVDAKSLIISSDKEVRKLAFENGLLGYTYIDIDAIGGTRAALDLIESRNLNPDFLLSRKEYTGLQDVEAISRISAKIVRKRPEIDKSMFINACNRAITEGRMTEDQFKSVIKNISTNSPWARLTSNLYKPLPIKLKSIVSNAPIGSFYYGDTSNVNDAKMDIKEVYNSISHMMNTGLYGKKLKNAILSRYTKSDLMQVKEIGSRISADDGIQGIYFINPTVYRDYGKGCAYGSSLFRKQGASRILAGRSCTGCTYQTAPSWCSKYSKKMIRSIPDSEKKIASNRRNSQLISLNDAPITNPVEEFGLCSTILIDPLKKPKFNKIDITIPFNDVSG